MAFPARRLQPGVAALHVEVLIRRFRAGVVQVGLTIVGVQPGVLADGVVVPGVADKFLHLAGVVQVDFVDGRQVAIEDRATRDHPGGRVIQPFGGEIAEGHEIAQAFAAREPVLVETGDGDRVGHIDLVDEVAHAVDDVADLAECDDVDCGGR